MKSAAPWEVSELCVSQIPKDLERLLQVYLAMGNFEYISEYFENYQRQFSFNLQQSYVESYIFALDRYMSEITRYSWMNSSRDETEARRSSTSLQENVKWIVSVANDCDDILHNDFFTCFRAEHDSLNDFIFKLKSSVTVVTDIAIDHLSCILFLVSGDILIDKNPYTHWKEENQFLSHFLKELDDWIHEFFYLSKPNKSPQLLLRSHIFEKLLLHLLEKMNMWYVYMISKINSSSMVSKAVLTPDDITHLQSDYTELLSFSRKYSNLVKNPLFEESLVHQLSLLCHILVILSEDYGNQLMLSINDFSIIAQRQSRSDLQILKKFVGMLLQLRGTYRVGSVDEDDEVDLVDVNPENLHQKLLILFDEPSDGDPQNTFDPTLVTKIFGGSVDPEFLRTRVYPSQSDRRASLIGISTSESSSQEIPTATENSIKSFLNISFIPSTRNFINISNVSLTNMMSIPERRDIFLEFSLPKIILQTPRLTTLNGNWGDEIFTLAVRQEILPSAPLTCSAKYIINRRMYLFQSTMLIGSITISLEELLANGTQYVQLPLNCSTDAIPYQKLGPPEISFILTLELNDLQRLSNKSTVN